MAHLDEYKLLSDRQHAFRKGHSCETQLTTVINDWAKILDTRGQVNTFILDFERHSIHALMKLFSYGIGGKTLKWTDSFLYFRQQRVVVNGVKTDWASVVCPTGLRSWSFVVLSVHKWHLIRYWVWNKTFCWWQYCVCYREIKDGDTLKLQRDIDRLGFWARKWDMLYMVQCELLQK